MKKVKYVIAAMILCGLLSGCTKRELEDRSFPTVLAIANIDIEAMQEERQEASTDYIDYGHVKAIVLSKEVATDSESLKEVLLYLEKRPMFANNILVFIGNQAVLEETAEGEGELGLYLEDMYKNQPRDAEYPKTILKDVLNYLHNAEAQIDIPYLEIKDKKILPVDQITLSADVVPAMNSPILRKSSE